VTCSTVQEEEKQDEKKAIKHGGRPKDLSGACVERSARRSAQSSALLEHLKVIETLLNDRRSHIMRIVVEQQALFHRRPSP
jgi:hypothetical protein